MMDIRLKTAPFELNGKRYTLTCNNNVLADVQEAYGGNLLLALDQARGLKATLAFLAAMINDSADTNGWTERFTARELGRIISLRELQEIGATVFELVRDAVAGEDEDTETKDEENEKN